MADILLIDDDEQVRWVMRRVLEKDGHVVRDAANGQDALRLMAERMAEIVVADVYMPEMDGLELLVRMQREYVAVRMIVMSGGGTMHAGDVLDIAATLGARATLSKPIAPADLRDAVARALID